MKLRKHQIYLDKIMGVPYFNVVTGKKLLLTIKNNFRQRYRCILETCYRGSSFTDTPNYFTDNVFWFSDLGTWVLGGFGLYYNRNQRFVGLHDKLFTRDRARKNRFVSKVNLTKYNFLNVLVFKYPNNVTVSYGIQRQRQ